MKSLLAMFKKKSHQVPLADGAACISLTSIKEPRGNWSWAWKVNCYLMPYSIVGSLPLSLPFMVSRSGSSWLNADILAQFSQHGIIALLNPLILFNCTFDSILVCLMLVLVGMLYVTPLIYSCLRLNRSHSVVFEPESLSFASTPNAGAGAKPLEVQISRFAWSDILQVRIRELLAEGFVLDKVLEIYLEDLEGGFKFRDDMRTLMISWFYLEKNGRHLVKDGEKHCIRIPFRMFSSESDKRQFLALLESHLGADIIDESVRAEYKYDDDSSLTSLWLAEFNSASASASTNRVLSDSQVLKGGSYVVSNPLGTGGYSVVYAAKRTDTTGNGAGAPVAIKEFVLNSAGVQDSLEQQFSQIVTEVNILKRLEHPAIVRFQDCFLEKGRFYVVLEQLEGVNLFDYIKQLTAPLGETVILDLFFQCCSAVEYLHLQTPAILHRDLAPDNFIIDGSGSRIKLLDFSAAVIHDLKNSGGVIGKHCYMAPEQFRGHSTESSDLYQLGATLFFIATGQEPEALTQSDPALVRADLSQSFCQIVRKLTALKSADRYTSASEVMRELDALRASLSNADEAFSLNLKVQEGEVVV